MSNCECACDKAGGTGEYSDYENCKCRKKLVASLIDECIETAEEGKKAKITLAENENSYNYSSWTVYIVLFSIFFTFFKNIFWNCYLFCLFSLVLWKRCYTFLLTHSNNNLLNI